MSTTTNAGVMNINMPANVYEVTLKTGGKYCEKDIRVTAQPNLRTESFSVTFPNDIKPGSATNGKTTIQTSHGTVEVVDVLYNGTATSLKVKLPCSPNAKMLEFHVDDTTFNAVKALSASENDSSRYVTSGILNFFASNVKNNGSVAVSLLLARKQYGTSDKPNYMIDAASTSSMSNEYPENDTLHGASFVAYALKAGTYNFTAYYWND